MHERTFLAKPNQCLTRGCHREAEVCGNCRTHYNSIWMDIMDGKYTRQEAEGAGILAPKQRGAKEYYMREIEHYRARRK